MNEDNDQAICCFMERGTLWAYVERTLEGISPQSEETKRKMKKI